jgi:pimeloyl-ACP methyl ester carboxylesterase
VTRLCSLILSVAVVATALGEMPRPERVDLDGIELHYAERGQGEPLVLLHGGMGDYRSWEPQLAAFAEAYRVIAYSRRYNFPNNNPELVPDHSPLVEADDLAKLLRRLDIPSAHFVGTSAGAFTALVLALRHSEMVRSLVMNEPPVHQLVRGEPRGDEVYAEFMRTIWRPAAEAFERGDDREAMRIFADGLGGRASFDTLPVQATAGMMQNARAIKALALSSSPFPAISKEELQQLRVPVLITTSERAIPIHRLVNERLAEFIPRSEHVVIANAGHAAPRENPTAFKIGRAHV